MDSLPIPAVERFPSDTPFDYAARQARVWKEMGHQPDAERLRDIELLHKHWDMMHDVLGKLLDSMPYTPPTRR